VYPPRVAAALADAILSLASNLASEARAVEGGTASPELIARLRAVLRASRGIDDGAGQTHVLFVLRIISANAPRVAHHAARSALRKRPAPTPAASASAARAKKTLRTVVDQMLRAYEAHYPIRDVSRARALFVDVSLAWSRGGGRGGWTTHMQTLWLALTGKPLKMTANALARLRNRAQL
jgi:hypothetical protein